MALWILVVSMVVAVLPASVIPGVAIGYGLRDPTAGVATVLGALALLPVLVVLVTVGVGPFYLAWQDVLLRPTPPYFRPAYWVFVIAPGIPGILFFTMMALDQGPAYPGAHLGIPSIIYEVEVIVGGWIYARLLAKEGSA